MEQYFELLISWKMNYLILRTLTEFTLLLRLYSLNKSPPRVILSALHSSNLLLPRKSQKCKESFLETSSIARDYITNTLWNKEVKERRKRDQVNKL